MKSLKQFILALAAAVAGLLPSYAQNDESEWENMLTVTREVEIPVYMPVVGIGVGYFNYYGNVNDTYRSLTMGKPGYRINVATFLDKKNHYFRGNLTFLTGELSGTQRSVADTSTYKNLNFNSHIYSFGFNVHYSFKPWITGKTFEPFISAGFETLQFSSKADYRNDKQSKRYYYWSDGTIRDAAENIAPNANIISRDYIYETDLRSENQNGLGGKYSQIALAIPIDLGIDFNLSPRVTLRAATSLHYALTDLIDDLSPKSTNPEYKGKPGNNKYTYTYLSLHLDLFTPPKFVTEELLNLDIEMDMSMYDDEDGDFVFDMVDMCPNTPGGELVDSLGCPYDDDIDGVPNYMDREPNTPPNVIVDQYGMEISSSAITEMLIAAALRRSEVESYLMMHRTQNRSRRAEALPIPEKFKKIDTNSDGYISFDELLKTINNYFDGSSEYTPADLNELNTFFFDQ